MIIVNFTWNTNDLQLSLSNYSVDCTVDHAFLNGELKLFSPSATTIQDANYDTHAEEQKTAGLMIITFVSLEKFLPHIYNYDNANKNKPQILIFCRKDHCVTALQGFHHVTRQRNSIGSLATLPLLD